MRLICAYSGVEFSTTYFGGIKGFTSVHPIFELPAKILLSRSIDFFKPETSRQERRLLFLALLNSSGQIEWRGMATPSDQVILQHFELLAHTIGWLDIYQYDIKHSRRIGPAFPKFVVSQETRNLSNIKYWLQSWQDSRDEYEKGTRRESISQRIARRERALTKLINDTSKSPEAFSWTLAHWAADATDFPENIKVRVKKADKSQGETEDSIITLRDYWISILTTKNIYEVREQDLVELEEHLTDNLEHGSIYAFNVLELVRGRLKKQKQSLGLGDIFTEEELLKIEQSPFNIISTDTVEQANVLAIASTAPTVEPIRSLFTNNFTYLQARAKWQVSQSLKPKGD
jgi:hypothetical protein